MTERRDFRQTKIICTLGPSSDSAERIEQLARAGMNVARLNMSHGDHDSHRRTIRHIRRLGLRLNHPIAVLMDLQGPAIRTGERRGNLELGVGEEFSVSVASTEDPEERASMSTTKTWCIN